MDSGVRLVHLEIAASIPVDRAARGGAIAGMLERARAELARGRQIIIFPEGTRTAPGAPPAYKQGIAHLYAATGVPCLPIALNSGLFWPRRKFLRYPGTIVLEVLDPIPPGLDKEAFTARLANDIESATAKLVAEGERQLARSGVPFVRAAQSLGQQMQIAVVETERLQRVHGREHVFAVRAGLAVALAHQMQLRGEIEPPGILHVAAVDHVDQRRDAPLRLASARSPSASSRDRRWSPARARAGRRSSPRGS